MTNLQKALCDFITPGTVFIGIGNCLRGDDALGPEFVAALAQQGLKVVDAGTVPENHIGSVARLFPESILIIDVVHLDREPGSVELLESDDISVATGFTTHTLSPVLVMDMLLQETGAPVKLLAVQPETLDFGASISPPVARTMEHLLNIINRCLDDGS